MNKTKHLFLKLLILLTFGVGWDVSAWAQRLLPTFAMTEAEATTWHYIFFPNNNGDKIYANTSNSKLNWASASTAPTDNFRWYLIGNKDNFILKSVSGKYVYTTQTATGRETAYQITDDAGLATHFNLVNGNNGNTWAIHRIGGDGGNNFNHRNNNEVKEWTVDNGSSVLFSNPTEMIKFSDTPSATTWAANTNWFTMRNNRSNQSGHNRKYITTSANGVNDQYALQPVLADIPNDRGSYWCFVGDASGFVIQNAAYGPDFVLGISGNNSNATVKMLRKGEIPSGYTYNFTAVDNSVIDDGTFAYAFRLGTSGNSHIHVTQGRFIIYTHTAIYSGDTGSAFKLTSVAPSAVEALTAYDVYHADTEDALTYTGSRAVFGKRNTTPYIILAQGGDEITKEHLTPNGDIYRVTVSTPSNSYIKEINVEKVGNRYRVNIISTDGIDVSGYKVKYNGAEYASGSEFLLQEDENLDGLTFQTTCNDKFVWGPVVDESTKTVTFDVRSNATTLTAGKFYQMVLRDKNGQVYNGSRVQSEISMVRAVNEFNTLRHQGQYLYVITAGNTEWTLELTGNYNTVKESATYVYVDGVSGNNVSMRMQNGQHVNQNGQGVASGTIPFVYQSATGAFKWNSNALPWNNLRNSKVGIGNTSAASSGNMEFFFHELNLVEYTLTAKDQDNNIIPATGIACTLDNAVAMDGKLYIPSAKASFDVSDFSAQFSITDVSVSGSTITLTVYLPSILHSQPYFYKNLEAESNKPVYGHIGTLEAGDNGMSRRDDNIDEQKTSVFEIPVYLQPGNHPRNLYLPSDKLQWYQRWYNYETDGLVDEGVMPALYSENYRIYKNGHISGNINGSTYKGYVTQPQLYLPTTQPTEIIDGKTFYKDYLLTMDISRYKDNRLEGEGNLREPTLSQRVIYRIMDANKIATEIKAKTDANDWYEKREIIFPCKKRGEASNNNTGADIVPLNMDLWNYWGYNSSDALVQLTADSQITVELASESTAQLKHYHLIDGTGGISRVNFNQGHFISFTYPDGNVAPDNSKAILNVYFTAGGIRYNLAQFTLIFQPNVEPKVITDVIGKNGEEYISSRSPHAMTEDYGKAIAQLQFDNTRVDMVAPSGGVDHYNDWGGWNSRGEYAYPLDFSMSNYGYGYGSDAGTSRGEYGIFKFSQATGANVPKYTFYPVKKYFDSILNPAVEDREFVENDDYIIYVDAADQAGQVMSIPIEGGLCPGTRLYCYGWMASNAGGSNPASVILSIVGHKSDGTTKVLSSYCPGILSAWAYRDQDDARIYSFNPTDNSVTTSHGGASNWGLWQQIGFSFMLDKEALDTYTSFSMSVYNNCYNSSGGDYLLDNFQIFANPPKGNVDFTTPLCSDKIRHAKIYSDFDMLRNLRGVKEDDPDAEITATYCFLDAEIFDGFEEGGLSIVDMFEQDDKGNHSLKPTYSDSDPKVINIINHAFREALVGSRYTKESNKEDHGFHTYTIPSTYTSIPLYAYNDSKTEVVYREVDDSGVRRLVFKEIIMRGEMHKEPAEPGKEDTHPAYWPYMRPSRTYYLVFSPVLASQTAIDNENTATDIFHIHESCSFFGKFTTKDPMHVILDNADIESDLPIKAVCHGETTTFSFDMPAMKMVKDENDKLKHPIVDEAYCTSDEDLDGQIVPSTQGLNHYRYEPIFETQEVYDVIKNMPYDWWLGGELKGKKFGGKIEDYLAATHPSINYDKPKDKAHKEDGEPVNIAQAMIDFRFFYPNEDGSTWSNVIPMEYNSNTGYGLLDSEIRAIKEFVDEGIILLHHTQYTMSLTAKNAENLTPDELSKMTSNELNSQILELALELDNDKAIATLLPLKKLEDKVIGMISPAGRKELTFQEFTNFTHEDYKNIAKKLRDEEHLLSLTDEQINAMPVADLRKTLETVLRDMTDAKLEAFAKYNFPNVGSAKRAHLVIRALNIMNEETLAAMTDAQRQDAEYIRATLREKMVTIFSAQNPVVLRKMWKDVAKKLTTTEQAELLAGRNPEDMDAASLGTVIEQSLGKITDNIIRELNSDQYIHFTLVPIMPSQQNYVDEPYIFCPEPRGVKIRISSHEPKMLNGFDNKTYPEKMENVPVRAGLEQINDVSHVKGTNITEDTKKLHIPLRNLTKALDEGLYLIPYEMAGSTPINTVFLVDTNDPEYENKFETLGAWGKVKMEAKFGATGNYMDLIFNDEYKMHEGYTYRIGVRFVEVTDEDKTIRDRACDGILYFDLKVVPEFQVWTGKNKDKYNQPAYVTEWTNDFNWDRADRSDLHADNYASDGTTKPLDGYVANGDKQTAASFVPMYFTNVLFKDSNIDASVLVNAGINDETGFLSITDAQNNRSGFEGKTMINHNVAPEVAFIKNHAPAKNTDVFSIVYDMSVNKDYSCELFGTNIANGVTFSPKTQLINAHYLNYNKAWVEYELAVNRWYTLASPLQNTFAGEWYSPTNGGRQLTPHFYGIEYNKDLNHRFKPAIYQRSWDSEGNNPVYLKTGGVQDAYIKADWSYVYNDVTKEYSNGGFSVNVTDDYMTNKPAGSKALIRMPKADTKYTYYDINNDTGDKRDDYIAVNANRNHLWSDKLKDDATDFTQDIENKTDGNNFFLVGNPFMANMDMDAFFEVNTQFEKKYWIMTAGGQAVSVKTESGWISTTPSLGKVAPLQGFFVKEEDGNKETTVTYNADMQSAATATEVLKSRPVTASSLQTLAMTVQHGDFTSTAIVALSSKASNEYVSSEDCETFIDSNIADQPTIYTVASGQAMTVNTVSAFDMIAVGIVGKMDEEVYVTFSGFDETLYLYDSESDEYSEIQEGTVVKMTCGASGRYFITELPTALNEITDDDFTRKGVWSLQGRFLGDSIKGLTPGVYIVDGVKMNIR